MAMLVETVKGTLEGVIVQKYRNESNCTWFVRCDSLQALQDAGKRPHASNIERSREYTDRPFESEYNNGSQSSMRVYGSKTGREAVKILESGQWEDGVKRMLDTMKQIDLQVQPRNIRRRKRWTDQGDTLDIHRVYSGQLDTAWQACKKRSVTASRNITIGVNLSINWDIPAEALFWRGAAALIVIDALTNAGYNVEVEVLHVGRRGMNNGDHYALSATVKEASAPLDLNSLAVMVCFGGFFRYSDWKALCVIPQLLSGSLGVATEWGNIVSRDMDDRDRIICERIFNKHHAEEWIKDTITQIEAQSEEIEA